MSKRSCLSQTILPQSAGPQRLMAISDSPSESRQRPTISLIASARPGRLPTGLAASASANARLAPRIVIATSKQDDARDDQPDAAGPDGIDPFPEGEPGQQRHRDIDQPRHRKGAAERHVAQDRHPDDE